MNLIDRVINEISPRAGLKRAYARQGLEIMNKGYSHHGASKTKSTFLSWILGRGGPDEDIVSNQKELIKRSRDLYMGTPLGCGIPKKFRANVVGAGLVPKPVIDYEFLGLKREEALEIERTIKREFELWAGSPNADSMRMHTFYMLQALTTLSWAMNGDVFAIPVLKQRQGVRSKLSIQIVEADRIMNPFEGSSNADIKGGVELSATGDLVAYHVADKHPGDEYTYSTKRIEAFGKTGRRNILHLFEPERPGQRRGVPVIAPVVEALKQLGRYSKAELDAAIISGIFGTFVKSDRGEDGEFGALGGVEEGEKITDSSKLEVSSSSLQTLNPGEDIVTVSPSRPNAQYKSFVDSIIEEIGCALEIPKEVLLNRFESSYSASRAAIEEAWKRFVAVRKLINDYFNQPIYEEFVLELVADGKVKAPGFFEDELKRKAYCKAMWVGPKKASLDPFKEVKAAQVRVQEHFTTREIECQEYGNDFEEVIKQRGNEERLIRELNIEGGE